MNGKIEIDHHSLSPPKHDTTSLPVPKIKLPATGGPIENVLGAACDSIGFDVAEMWLRIGPKTHQLIHSYIRHSHLDDKVRSEIIDVYHGHNAQYKVHKLSSALCKKVRQSNDIFSVTAQTDIGAQALKYSLFGVLSAIAVPADSCCYCGGERIGESGGLVYKSFEMTIIYLSAKKAVMMQPAANEFLMHMSIAAANLSVNMCYDNVLVLTSISEQRKGGDANDDENDKEENKQREGKSKERNG
jgi:hypothetical protein